MSGARTSANNFTRTIMQACNNFAMVGVKNILQDGDKNWIRVSFKGSRKCNTMTVKLNGLDLLDVEFGKLVNKQVPNSVIKMKMPVLETKAKHDSIYIDMLKPIFEEETGLYLSF
jgi:hypothetical protein